MSSNSAFFLVILGLLSVYCEFIWPGRVWQAVLGLAALIMGAHSLLQLGPTVVGLAMLGSAAVFFLVDAYVDTNFVLGIAGTIGMTLGFLQLIPGERKISAWVAAPLCVLLGAITMALNWAARRARNNKRAVIQ